jgi:hypothetical protein
MIEAKDVQRCGHGCCIYVRGQQITKEEYGERVAKGEIVRHTQIGCLTHRGSKIVKAAAVELGFYFGVASSRRTIPAEGFVYDTKTHSYLRMATGEDARKWLKALVPKKILVRSLPVGAILVRRFFPATAGENRARPRPGERGGNR